MKTEDLLRIENLGQLKASGYKSLPVKEELRANLIKKIRGGEPLFEGIIGYEDTVMPDIQRAILSRHNMNLLGLRGQAKTRIARTLISLLDPVIPVLADGSLNDDPFHPLSIEGKTSIAQKGDEAPIRWLAREDRYVEKLATPDVTVADLIGDVDPIKAANLKIDYTDERVIHYGLIPRSNRCIFVINELPDLQPRIQVSLFNILQEGDIQIRGFQLRLPLDIQFVFTANPEDYTQRGAIITPLKDRIQSQILTHYPRSLEIARSITEQESNISDEQKEIVVVHELLQDLVERLAFEARESEFIDHKSGVSARMSITAYENLVSAAELRALENGESKTAARIVDLLGVVPAVTGKVELVYEGEQEGSRNVAMRLIGAAIRSKFPQIFPDPELIKRKKLEDPYAQIIQWFGSNDLEFLNEDNSKDYREKLDAIPGLREVVERYNPGLSGDELYLSMEFLLHGLAEFSLLSKHELDGGLFFSDLFNSLFSGEEDEDQTFG